MGLKPGLLQMRPLSVVVNIFAKRRSEYLYVAIGSSKRLALWFGSSFLIMGPVKVKIFLMLHLPLL